MASTNNEKSTYNDMVEISMDENAKEPETLSPCGSHALVTSTSKHSSADTEQAGQHHSDDPNTTNGQVTPVEPIDTNATFSKEKLQQLDAAAARQSFKQGHRGFPSSLHSTGSTKKPRSLIGSAYVRSRHADGQTTIRPIHSFAQLQNSKTKDPAGSPELLFLEDQGEATWKDVGRACCCHSREGWFHISIVLSMLLFFLYFFLVGLDLMGTSFAVAGGCTAGSMLSADTNPMASLMIGIIATALLQSSSTTTAIIVTLVSGGLDVHQGIYMVMGANVGTSVTAMLVSMAHMGDGDELERAFAGSSVQYVFKILCVIPLFPIEIIFEYLYRLTKLMLPSSVGEGESWEGPVKKMVSPLVNKIIIANKQLIDDISAGTVESCSSEGIYPVTCLEGEETYESCNSGLNGTSIGVIACDEDGGNCPLFFQDGASKDDDMVSGWVCMVLGLTILIVCLLGLVAVLRKMLAGASTQIIYKATNINPYLAMIIGCGITILVQSSSITTSTLVPLAGVGVLSLENMYPLVLGADVGTTFTALMAALVSSKVESLQIALVHLFFNITGILMWYPIPFMRNIPLRTATLIGKITRQWRGFPPVFILTMFFIVPLLLLSISSCFEQGSVGFTALGSFIVFLIVAGVAYFAMWWYFRDGKHKCASCIEHRQRRAAAIKALADDMDYLKVDTEWCKNEIGRIKDYTGDHQHGSTSRIEEGRPVVTTASSSARIVDDGTINDDVDRVSVFESCRSASWKDVLYSGAGSIKSGL